MKIIHQIEEDRKQMHPAIQKSMDCRIVSFAFHILIEIPKEHIEMRMNLFRIIKEYRTRVLFDSCARRKTRIACLLSFGGIFLVSLMANCSKSRK